MGRGCFFFFGGLTLRGEESVSLQVCCCASEQQLWAAPDVLNKDFYPFSRLQTRGLLCPELCLPGPVLLKECVQLDIFTLCDVFRNI